MASRKLKLALLLGTGLVAGGGIVAWSASAPAESEAAQLLDPSYVAAGVCGRGSRHAAAFKPLRLALIARAAAAETADQPPPLWDGLGDLSYRVTTGSEQAQRYFDQGLRLTYGFNHAEALRAFRAAQSQDPKCAMCYWGEAFVLRAQHQRADGSGGERAGARGTRDRPRRWRPRRARASGR